MAERQALLIGKTLKIGDLGSHWVKARERLNAYEEQSEIAHQHTTLVNRANMKRQDKLAIV